MTVLMLIKTLGLEYDDRIRKEASALRALGASVRIAALEERNAASARVVYRNIPAKTIHLRSRHWFRRRSGLWVKTAELYAQFLLEVLRARPDVIWIHNMELAGTVPFLAVARSIGLVKRLIWDQHELPPEWALSNQRALAVLTRLCNLCDVIIMANHQRKVFLRQLLGRGLKAPIAVLENFPDREFADLPREPLPAEVAQWLGHSPYVLAQGGANPRRYLDRLVKAVVQTEGLKLIVVGPYSEAHSTGLSLEYGSTLGEKVLFTGPIPQMELAPFIDRSIASVVLYDDRQRNSELCAPNRLYQAVSRGIPVLVGSNPPMAEFVNRLGCGVVLATDGRDERDISQGLCRILGGSSEYRLRAREGRDQAVWETQLATLAKIAGFSDERLPV